MTKAQTWQQLLRGYHSLQVLRPVVADFPELRQLLQHMGETSAPGQRSDWRESEFAASFIARLWQAGRSWRHWLAERIVWCEHPLAYWTEVRGGLAHVPPELVQAAKRDLGVLQQLADVLPAALQAAQAGEALAWPPAALASASEPGAAPVLELVRSANWPDSLPALAAVWSGRGAGMLGRYDAFRWSGAKQQLEPILRPDPIQLTDLHGYETQREAVLANTRQFVAGHSANNLLLYGDRGTGKSSLVKALRSAFAEHGLRLVEVAKEDLGDLSQVLEQLAGRRGRFILFVDDLSFGEGEDYRGLKAVLEGSLVARPANVLVYATTNRRHLVHETRGERLAASSDGTVAYAALQAQGEAAALNPRDVLQEKLSLADRFGQTIAFPAPDQAEYLAIVTHLAQQRGLKLPLAELHQQALRWEQWHNGRSGRTARQFIDDLVGRLSLTDKSAG